jgi:dienelactone hydrolase
VSERLLSWGYIALLVDSFTTRGIDHACTPEKSFAEEINIVKRTARPSIPTIILVGELDDWTPAKDCARTVARWGNAGPPVQLVTYPVPTIRSMLPTSSPVE